MTTLLLIRHGQSEANLTHVFAGHLDAALTELGCQQAQRTADFIAGKYAVDGVYGSDLQRAFETGRALAQKLGLPILPEPGLREIEAGRWEGVPFETLQQVYAGDYGLWLSDIGNARPTGGESVEELARRVEGALRRIAQENPGKTIAVATHATPIRAMQWHLSGRPLSHMKQIPWVSNASVTELFFENGAFRLGNVAQDSHLQELRTRLPKNV